MPGKPSPVFLLLKEIAKVRLKSTWVNPRPIYAAAGMIVVASLLMLSAIGGIKQASRPESIPNMPISNAAQPEVSPPIKQQPVAVSQELAEHPSTKVIAQNKPVAPARIQQQPRYPVQGETKLGYGWQLHPIYNDWRYHAGQDFSVPADSPVKAALGGRVGRIYKDAAFGLAVVVESQTHTVIYASLERTELKEGQQIDAGTKIGTVGECPGEPYPHLHLAVKNGEKYIDPAEWLGKVD